jgi:predicted phosphodiesterase
MKLWIMSDLHLDVNARHPYALPDPRPDHDAVVIAGDIQAGMADAVRWIAREGLNERPVVYVGGNHEFYGRDRLRGLQEGLEEAGRQPNIRILERRSLSIGGVLFVGCTLWTDYELFGDVGLAMAHAATGLNDHRLIRHGKGFWMPGDAAAEHQEARAFIHGQIDQPGTRKVVVVTHHAPSLRSAAARWQRDLLTAAFASDCKLLADRVTLWVHGHMHAPADYRLGHCRVVCNPRGYVDGGEAAAFNPVLVVEI